MEFPARPGGLDPAWSKEIDLPDGLRSSRIQLWLVQLSSPEAPLEEFRRILSPDELERADRFAVEHARRNFLVTRGALRMVLGAQVQIHPGELQFRYSSKGKPSLALKQNSSLSFNVSHSGDLALIAVAQAARVGVDIERVNNNRDLTSIARSCWAAPEQDVLNRADPSQAASIFYRLWTRKEAVLKANGQGITSGLEVPDVSAGLLDRPRNDRLDVQLANTWWRVYDLDPAPEYEAAVALELEERA